MKESDFSFRNLKNPYYHGAEIMVTGKTEKAREFLSQIVKEDGLVSSREGRGVAFGVGDGVVVVERMWAAGFVGEKLDTLTIYDGDDGDGCDLFYDW
jgi:hypothetical protein